MAFTLKTNIIESDEGFSVEVLGRIGLKYIENGKEFFVDSEIANPGIIVFKDVINDWETKIRISDNKKREEIINNIIRAFQFKGIHIEVS